MEQSVRLVSAWTIAILVVSVALILGGISGVNALIEYAAAEQNSGSATSFYVIYFGMYASPLAIALGVAGLMGLLFLGATSKRR